MLNLSGKEQTASSKLRVGDSAPDFTLLDQANKPVHFADLIGQNVIVLYFYPKDFSGGCTAEACAFRDSYEDFKKAGATVIGVSADSAESHENFAKKYQLPYILLSDPKSVVHKLYGLQKSLGFIPERITFVIDKQGVIRHAFSSQINIKGHITEALKIIQSLQ